MKQWQSFWLMLQSLWLKFRPQKDTTPAIEKDISRHGGTFTFLKAFADDPKSIGAVLPSSKQLAREMVSHVSLSSSGVVIELGPGTGAITRALLVSGVSPEKIIAIEYSAKMADRLKRAFPKIRVIVGDAAYLVDLLKEMDLCIDAIISSLPLRSLPQETVRSVLTAIPAVLSEQGRYIQYTYDIRNETRYYPDHYQLEHARVVWWNIPPAKVEVFSIL